MILEELRELSTPGGSFSITLPKQWVEGNLTSNQNGKFTVLFRINGKVITILPPSERYRASSQGKPIIAHSAFEAIAQHLEKDPERTLAILQKEEPATESSDQPLQ
jgi:hypothetical protein